MGRGLIRSWNTAGWVDLPLRVGNKIAQLVGAGTDEVVVADSTSVNLYKALCAALDLARADAPGRTIIVSERDNFPTDLYIAEVLARERGCALRMVDGDRSRQRSTTRRPCSCSRTSTTAPGACTACTTSIARRMRAGALVVWDLAHSAGAVPVDLHGAGRWKLPRTSRSVAATSI